MPPVDLTCPLPPQSFSDSAKDSRSSRTGLGGIKLGLSKPCREPRLQAVSLSLASVCASRNLLQVLRKDLDDCSPIFEQIEDWTEVNPRTFHRNHIHLMSVQPGVSGQQTRCHRGEGSHVLLHASVRLRDHHCGHCCRASGYQSPHNAHRSLVPLFCLLDNRDQHEVRKNGQISSTCSSLTGGNILFFWTHLDRLGIRT